jgi:hypothetical protein
LILINNSTVHLIAKQSCAVLLTLTRLYTLFLLFIQSFLVERPLLPVFTMESGPEVNLSAEEKFQIDQYNKIVKFAEAVLTGSHPRIRIESHCSTGSIVSSSVSVILHMLVWRHEGSIDAAEEQSSLIARCGVHLCQSHHHGRYTHPATHRGQFARRKSELLSTIGPRIPSLA